MTTVPPESPTRRQIYFWAAGAVALILILLVTFNKQGEDPAKTNQARDDDDTAAAELRGQLLATLDGLRPERLNVSSDEENIVGDLNLWWAEYSQTVQVRGANEPAALLREWLGEEAAANVAADRFVARDAAHIRNALLYRAAAASLVANHASDRDCALAAFQLVVRHISLMSTFVEPAPLGSFEVLLAGRGTADDRIWLLAEILRQLAIDCVVLELPSPEDDAKPPAKLVGAIVEGEGVLLFDPELGLPIPKRNDTSGALPDSVATLRDALQDDAVFRQFDVPDGPVYPWSSAALEQVEVRYVLDSTYAAPRMLAVQTALPEEYAATLFDGPPPSDDSPSLKSRVIAAGADGLWDAESVAAWTYPERQMQAFFAAGGESSPDARSRMATLYGPRVLQFQQSEGGRQRVAVDSRRPLRVVRVQHVRGELLDALRGYGEVRSAPLEAGNAEVREDAIHWIALCQEELERYDVAVSTLTLMLRDYPNGLWAAVSQRSLARCEALRDSPQRAVDLLPATAEGETPNFADAYLRRRWQALAKPEPTDGQTAGADSAGE